MNTYKIPTEIINIQTPASLYCKLDYLRQFKGKKIVIIGDSVIYGRSMQEAGDTKWREHTISAFLQEELKTTEISTPVLVMNIGINGALPTDLEYLIKLIVPLKIDLLICDISLRSFSKDFNSPETNLSRPWIERLSLDDQGRYCYYNTNLSFIQKIEDFFHTFFVNHLALYRYRDYIQWLVLDSEPAQFVIYWRDQLNAFLTKASPQEEDSLILALKAKSRYASISLSESSQYTALKRIITYLEAIRQKTIIFYATENPQTIHQIISKDQHTLLLKDLNLLLGNQQLKNIVYVPPLSELNVGHYIDHVHLNEKGYKVVAHKLYELISRNVFVSNKDLSY